MDIMGKANFEGLPVQVHERICCWLEVYIYGPDRSYLSSPSRRNFPCYYRYVGLHTVAALARTSRTLHVPAVNILWRWIPNIAVLMHTLPDDCYRTRHLEREDSRETTTFVSLPSGRLKQLWVLTAGAGCRPPTRGRGPCAIPNVRRTCRQSGSVELPREVRLPSRRSGQLCCDSRCSPGACSSRNSS